MMSPEELYTLIAAVSGFAASVILGWQTSVLFKEVAVELPKQTKNIERTDLLITGFALLAASAFFWKMTEFV